MKIINKNCKFKNIQKSFYKIFPCRNQSQEKQPIISNQRFQPLLSSNETNNLPQQSSTNLSNSVSNQVNNTQQLVREPAGRSEFERIY